MTHQAPSTMQAWPTSMNVFLTTTFSVPFAQFGDIMRHQWRKTMLHQVSLVFMNELHHKHILKRKGLYSTTQHLDANVARPEVFFGLKLNELCTFAAEKITELTLHDTIPWEPRPTFIQWQLQHGTRHVFSVIATTLLPHRVVVVFTAVVSPPSKRAETKCSE